MAEAEAEAEADAEAEAEWTTIKKAKSRSWRVGESPRLSLRLHFYQRRVQR